MSLSGLAAGGRACVRVPPEPCIAPVRQVPVTPLPSRWSRAFPVRLRRGAATIRRSIAARNNARFACPRGTFIGFENAQPGWSYTSRAAYELDGALKLIHEFECFSSDMVGQAGIDDAPQASPFDLARCVGLEVEYRLGRAQDCVRFWVLDE